MDLKGKKVLIVGFGKSGEAALRFALSHGAKAAVTDLRDEKALAGSVKIFGHQPVDWFLGSHDANVFESADLIVVSPGVPLNLPAMQSAKQKGIPVVSELELALCQKEPGTFGAPTPKRARHLLAVTGTNGKTTTASLIHHLLTTAGRKSLLAGNIGRPLLDCLEKMKGAEFLVLEISSYQLETTPSLKPDAGILLNITEDHLHWHESFAGYVQAKAKLVRQTAPDGLMIHNAEDDLVVQCVEQIPSRRFPFSAKRRLKLGGWVEEGELFLKTEWKEEPVRFDLAKAALKGIPNWENMLAALLSVYPYIKDAAVLQKGLETFVPLPHRLQVVKERKGVTYINDSKATNVGATLKAFAGLSPPILWIAGGQDKGGSYAPLKEPVKKKVRKAFLLGEAREKMAGVFKGDTDVILVNDLKEAVAMAAKEARAGETVLFSPACASFDMFRDYEDRGNQFCAYVRMCV